MMLFISFLAKHISNVHGCVIRQSAIRLPVSHAEDDSVTLLKAHVHCGRFDRGEREFPRSAEPLQFKIDVTFYRWFKSNSIVRDDESVSSSILVLIQILEDVV